MSFNNNIVIPPNPVTKRSILWDGILLCFPPIGTFIGGLLLLSRVYKSLTGKAYDRYRVYANIIGDHKCISASEIANRSGIALDVVERDLQKMSSKGFLGRQSFYDFSIHAIVMDRQGAERTTTFRNRARAVNFTEKNRVEVPVNDGASSADSKTESAQPKSAPQPAQPSKAGTVSIDEFESKLREIRVLNDAIDDKEVSDRIDRIEELTAGIFSVLRDHPDRRDEVHKFMNYYLPTTFKLLKSYSLLEKQSYQGETITASRKKIESILDTLIFAFSQMHDNLFKEEALDIDSDISVLETMIAKDGLSERGRMVR